MKKLFVLAAVLSFSIAVVAQTSERTEKPAEKAEKTCSEYKAEGTCPRATDTDKSCAEHKEAGRCPKAKAEAKSVRMNAAKVGEAKVEKSACAASAETKSCGGCKNKQQAGKPQHSRLQQQGNRSR
jgi:hypothetical protein